ncbi:ankyrin repeat-containing protein [Anaeramoeba ignava]|uniref:Ankyrin repeat-containing protein n=1 Tax=Anaeramoeba ignava TaxID=1746090 RepID=A0A9Q0R6V5_ANAIG|nr:ankyrin repeat-containing protein [Anaeramoeba ignava]
METLKQIFENLSEKILETALELNDNNLEKATEYLFEEENIKFIKEILEETEIKTETETDFLMIDNPDKIDEIFLSITYEEKLKVEQGLEIYGCDIREKHTQNPPLHYACLHKASEEMIEIIIQSGASVNDTNSDGQNALHLACMTYDSQTIISLLLSYNPQVNLKDNNGNTCLMFAAENQALDVISVLLSHGADPNIQHPKKGSVLFVAIRKRPSIDLLKTLIEGGADPTAEFQGSSLLEQAVAHGCDAPIINFLIEKGNDPNHLTSKGYNSLHFLFLRKESSADIAQALLEAGADPFQSYSKGLSPLHLAIKNNHDWHVCHLLFASISAQEIQVLEQKTKLPMIINAILSDRNLEVIQSLVSHGFSTTKSDSKSQSPFFHSIKKSNLQLIQFLLESGCQANPILNNKEVLNPKKNPLMCALQFSDSSSVLNLLIKYGAKISSKLVWKSFLFGFDKAKTIYENFIEQNGIIENLDWKILKTKNLMEQDVVDFFLHTFGDKINQVDNSQKNALHYVCENPSITPKLLRMFLEKGANVSAIDKNSEIPLIYLLRNKDIRDCDLMIKDMVKFGLNLDMYFSETKMYLISKIACDNNISNSAFDSFMVCCDNIDPLNQDLITTIDYLLLHKDAKERIKIFHKYDSFSENFKSLYQKKSQSDLKIEFLNKEILSIHSGMINCRIGKEKLKSLIDFCKTQKKENIECFFEWIYSAKLFKIDETSLKNNSNQNFEQKSKLRMEKLNQIFEISKSSNIFQNIQQILQKSNQKGLKNDIKLLFNNQNNSDFCLNCEKGNNIYLHKFILISRSNLFYSMFESVQDSSNCVKDYSGINFNSVKEYFHFLYFDELNESINLNSSITNDLIQLSEFYQIFDSFKLKKLLKI